MDALKEQDDKQEADEVCTCSQTRGGEAIIFKPYLAWAPRSTGVVQGIEQQECSFSC